ncbi:MAG: cellulase family glycosylhydrolase [Spirochaetales bacterium]|nr:cellulase family glycosylhydrolase [Spirochaetales bacterium]
MKKKEVFTIRLRIYLVFGMILMLAGPVFAQTDPVWRVDDQGNITVDGRIFRIRGGAWTGLEGRQEPSDDPNNPNGAPMEMYIGNCWWNPSGRTYEQDITEFKQTGFNLIRLPIVPQTLDPEDPQGREPYLKNDPAVHIDNARLAMETVISLLDEAGIYVLLDLHSCSNYVGWKAGRLNDSEPFPKHCWEPDNYDYEWGNELYCDYSVAEWLDDLRELAGLGAELGVTNIMGIDIFNEPWDYSWDEWRSLIDQAYAAIDEVNPNILIFAEGIGSSNGDGDADSPHGAEETTPCWGENLYEAADNPPSMPKNRLVYCPHTFGPSVAVQRQFMDPARPECGGLEGDEAASNQCDIVIEPYLLEQGWEEHFGYLKELGYAVVIGAFGGNPDWPDKTEECIRDRWGWLPDKTVDWQWQNAFADYLISKGIQDAVYWSINPEEKLTGGVYHHAYDPVSNKGGWGTWQGMDYKKLQLLYKIWDQGGDPPPPTPVSTLTPAPGERGDVNGDNVIGIIDALLTAQYYVGLDPEGFITGNADVDCDGSISIIDALMIARYYVGLLSSFGC